MKNGIVFESMSQHILFTILLLAQAVLLDLPPLPIMWNFS